MNFVIVRTRGGTKYARRIGHELRELGHHYRIPSHDNIRELIRSTGWRRDNTVIHARAAYPSRSGFMGVLFELERNGWAVINTPDALLLTSDKLACARMLEDSGMWQPRTEAIAGVREIPKVYEFLANHHTCVTKPVASQGNGKYVHVIDRQTRRGQLEYIIREPAGAIMVQEYIPYIALHRVVVLNGEPIRTVWTDRPTRDRWKVSVCLNPAMKVTNNPPRALTDLAVRAQEIVGGDINFVDIFECRWDLSRMCPTFVIGEINTACSLLRHERMSGINIAKRIAETMLRLVS